MTCDLLVIAPHPDDAELHAGATIARHTRLGASVVVVDCSRGESASRGSPEQRAAEAAAAAAIWGLQARENLALPDGGLNAADPDQRRALVDVLRRHAPTVVLTIAEQARHPDHRACHHLARDAVKSAAIHGYASPSGAPACSPHGLLFFEAELPLSQPTLLVPADEADTAIKARCLACYHSQWGDPDHGPKTAIAQPQFLQWIEHRGRSWGYHAGSPYAEAFTSMSPWPCKNLLA